jgi:hypothetical protein
MTNAVSSTAHAPRPAAVDASTVEWAQWILNRAEGEKLDADGVIGKLTRAALVRCQTRHSLQPSGDIDRATHTALLQLALEWLLQEALFTSKGVLDGHTSEQLQNYQHRAGLAVDGDFGPNTRAAMVRSLRAGKPLAALQVPPGFRTDPRKRGLIRYSGDRLDRALDGLRQRKLVDLSDDDLDTLQRIANIETSGGTQGINTWDSAVVSIGFMQWTLEHGKVQKWIVAAPAAFERHGIVLDPGLSYRWGETRTQTGIQGVRDMESLRWGAWAERFFQVGLDEEALVAEVALARQYLAAHLDGLRSRLARAGVHQQSYGVFERHYQASLNVRGMFQAAFNNLPAAATDAVHRALLACQPEDDARAFEAHLAEGIRAAFTARGKGDRGERVTSRTLEGARL